MLRYLQDYADMHALPETAAHLEQAQMLAQLEIANLPDAQDDGPTA